MHVAVVGAGSLGRIYGVHLASVGERVSFVVRESRLSETDGFALQRLNGGRERVELPAPDRVASVPVGVSCVLLAVRTDQIDDALATVLSTAPPVPVVTLTPVLPADLERLEALVGGRVAVAMPTVAGLLEDGVVRYWSFRRSPTLVERRREHLPTLTALVDVLNRSGLGARLSRDVRRRNPATTVTFFPLSLALSLAGSARSLASETELLELAAGGCRETLRLARRLGPIELPAALVARCVRPWWLSRALQLADRAFPRATHFVDQHFGAKLKSQHRRLSEEILALGRTHHVAMPAFGELVARAAERDAST